MSLPVAAKNICLAGFVLMMAGCTEANEPMNIHGAKGFHVYCGGAPYADTSDCESHARDMCDGDYTILTDSQPPYAHSQALWDNSTRDITVRCNNPK